MSWSSQWSLSFWMFYMLQYILSTWTLASSREFLKTFCPSWNWCFHRSEEVKY
jgi:hypothetical protein